MTFSNSASSLATLFLVSRYFFKFETKLLQACSLLALRTSTFVLYFCDGCGASLRGNTESALSIMTWALVPPAPKLLIEARRTPLGPSGHCSATVTTLRLADSKGTSGFGLSKLTDGGIRPFSMASATFIMPASPLVTSMWPMLVLMEPMRRG